MIVIGIDPGDSGAIAVTNGTGLDTIKLTETERDIWEWLLELKKKKPAKIYLEKVNSMPAQGVSSTFKFGTSFGFCRGIIVASGIPFEMVRPQAWQKSLECLSGGNKNVTKQKAQEIFPGTKFTHATADAALIAYYGLLVERKVNSSR